MRALKNQTIAATPAIGSKVSVPTFQLRATMMPATPMNCNALAMMLSTPLMAISCSVSTSPMTRASKSPLRRSWKKRREWLCSFR